MNIQALISLWNVTQLHPGTSGGRACAAVLLGLYNGQRFPLDMTELRHLDGSNLTAAIDVIESDARFCFKEVHEWLNEITGTREFGMRFEHLACEYEFKGRRKESLLPPLSSAQMVIRQSVEARSLPSLSKLRELQRGGHAS